MNCFQAINLLDKKRKETIIDLLIFNFQPINEYSVKFDNNGKPIHPAKTEKNWNLNMKKLYDKAYKVWKKNK